MSQEAEDRAPARAASISARSSDTRDEELADVRLLDRVPRLVERAKSGDEDAFGELYKMYAPAIFRMARARLPEGAEDVVAETFLRAWSGLPRHRDVGAPFLAWLYGIGRHVVLDEMRRRGRVEPWEQVPDVVVSATTDDRLDLNAALAHLPDEQRQVIELKFLLGLSNKEVGAALGKSPGAVNAQQWRALRALREVLDVDG